MKRYISLAIALVLLLCLVGCGEEMPQNNTTTHAVTTVGTTTSAVSTEQQPTQTTVTDESAETTTTQTASTTTAPTDGVVCAHKNVKKATCEQPSTCADCGAKLGEALGHDFQGKTCSRCKERNPDYVPRIEVIGIELDMTEAEMLIGDTVTLTHTLKPSIATDKAVTWKSSNPSIATVSAEGKVTALAVGETVITVSSLNGKTATCKINVRDIVVDMPDFPKELFYNAQHNNVAIYMMMEGVDYTFTQTAPNQGNLLLMFNGELTYAGDGHGGYTYPNFGWRLYNSSDVQIAEGVAQSDEALAVGSSIAGLTVEIQSVKLGKYRLELYSTYKKKN